MWARGASQKNLGPLRIFAIVEASNFKFGTQVEFVTSLPKTTFMTKTGGASSPGWARLASEKKIWDPLFISATVEASD